jgi:hypothetical protein
MNKHTPISTQPTASGLPFVLRISPSGPVGCVGMSEESSMIESTAKPSEILSDKGTDRLLADIAVDVDQSAAWAEKVIREKLGEPVTVFVNRCRYYSRHSDRTQLYWRIQVESPDIFVTSKDTDVLNEAIGHVCRQYETQRRVNKQMAEVEAAERATSVTDAAYRDSGDATTGTLPITSIGPSGIGGEYQNEVRP